MKKFPFQITMREARRLVRWKQLAQWLHHWSPSTIAFALLSLLLIGSSDLRSAKAPGRLQGTVKAVAMVPAPLELETPKSGTAWQFFFPIWQKDSLWSFFQSASRSENPLETFTDLKVYLDDPDSRLDKEFKVTSAMKARVHFWMEVFARFSSRIRIVHDRLNPEIVYGYIDMRPLYRGTSSVGAQLRGSQIEKKVIAELKARLQEAAGQTKTNLLTPDEKSELKTLLSRLGGLDRTGLAKVISNIRTQTGQSDMFLSALERSRLLLPHIESVFRLNGMPAGLARIPFIESAFNTKAQSKVGAMGIWQLMPETARQMIHSTEESRWAEPLQQTRGAARLLALYRNILPDWGLAVTAYNSGVGRIKRLSQKYKLKSAEGLSDLPESEDLGFAGRNFYPEFLAVNIIEAYKEEIFRHMLPDSNYSLVFKDSVLPKETCGF